MENEYVGEGTIERLGEGLADGILDGADPLPERVSNDGDIKEVVDEDVETVLDVGAEKMPGNVTGAKLEVDLGSCVLRPEGIKAPA